MKLPSSIRFTDEKIKESFYKLENGDESERALFRSISKALDAIEKDAFVGIQVPKKLVPKEYKAKFKLKNLWKYNLPKGWRLMYSVFNEEVIVISLIIEWVDHKDYEQRFRY